MYFDDVLGDHDSRMGYKMTDPFKNTAWKMFNMKIKAHGLNAGVTQSAEFHENKVTQKSKLMQRHGDEMKSKLTTSNGQHAGKVEYKPSSMNNDGQELELEVSAVCKPSSNEWEGKVQLKTGGYELGPIKPWIDFSFEQNDKGNQSIQYQQNNKMDDYHVGWRVNMENNKLDSAYGLLAMTGSNGNYYFRSNCMTHLLGVGTWTTTDSGATHSLEAQYDLKKANPGIGGMPLYLRYGYANKLGALDYNCNIRWADNITWTDKVSFQINENLGVKLQSTINKDDLIMNPSSAKPNIGATFTLNL